MQPLFLFVGAEAAPAPTEFCAFSYACVTGFRKPSVWFVGVDAHIDPAVQTDFTEIQSEFDGTQWGDVGIDPYAVVVIE